MLNEREILNNLKAICADAENVPLQDVASGAMGVLTTENRKIWSRLRKVLAADPENGESLQVVDQALFVVCLDDVSPENEAELCSNYLCGTYKLQNGVQVGTCTNRWYDKVRLLYWPRPSPGAN